MTRIERIIDLLEDECRDNGFRELVKQLILHDEGTIAGELQAHLDEQIVE